MPDEIHIERMRQALRVMREVVEQEKPFDISSWIRPHLCGTVACASGYLQLDPWHQGQGLGTNDGHDGAFRYPIFLGSTEYRALLKYFGVADGEIFKIYDIFDPDKYTSLRPSPVTVLRRMEKHFHPYTEGVPA
ncbi:hypothetical protein [Acidiphilium angustum]|uniref:hypothetical protein n=1 Tax=Acidiphilium angustum TaxID=523 RepID=UPI0004946F33|nr:hypothetical protein [Acidiphilium angustum]